MSESVEAKARRYLAEGRLTITRVVGDDVRATCRGSGEVYEVGHDVERVVWFCSCPARGRCSHLVALQLVTIRRSGA